MVKKFDDKTLDFWEEMLSDPGVCIDFDPHSDPERAISELREIREAIEARKKERAKKEADEKRSHERD